LAIPGPSIDVIFLGIKGRNRTEEMVGSAGLSEGQQSTEAIAFILCGLAKIRIIYEHFILVSSGQCCGFYHIE